MGPIEPPSVSQKLAVVEASRHNFTKPRDTVEQIVNDLHTPVAPKDDRSKNTKQTEGKNKSDRGGNNQQSNQQRASQSTKDTTTRQKKPGGTRDLSELRSVLGKMAVEQSNTKESKKNHQETKSAQDSQNKATNANQPSNNQSANDPRAALSDALRQVLPNPADNTDITSSGSTDKNQSKADTAKAESTQSTSPSKEVNQSSAPATASKETTTPNSGPDQLKSQSDPLSPQTLKRMMRKGGSHRSPFV
jgi:hypothetical protein